MWFSKRAVQKLYTIIGLAKIARLWMIQPENITNGNTGCLKAQSCNNYFAKVADLKDSKQLGSNFQLSPRQNTLQRSVVQSQFIHK